MGWVDIKERFPPKVGEYMVVKFNPGTKEMGFFNPIPPSKSIECMDYVETMEMEGDYADRCVYVKFKCFMNKHGIKQKKWDIIYWYELDEIPNDEYLMVNG